MNLFAHIIKFTEQTTAGLTTLVSFSYGHKNFFVNYFTHVTVLFLTKTGGVAPLLNFYY